MNLLIIGVGAYPAAEYGIFKISAHIYMEKKYIPME